VIRLAELILRGIVFLLELWYNRKSGAEDRIRGLEERRAEDRLTDRLRDQEDAEKIVASGDSAAALDFLRKSLPAETDRR
jgi:hypothetical protein